MRDVLMTKTVALPAAAATATTAALDLEGSGGAHLAGKAYFELEVPATASLVSTKKITVALTECATLGGSYTAAVGYGNTVITGGGSGGAATKFKLAIHPGTLRYVKGTFSVESGGGDNTAVTATFAVVIP